MVTHESPRRGQFRASRRPILRRRHGLTPLIAVTGAALVFTVLLILVRLQWAPLESADHGAATDLNRLIAGHAVAVSRGQGDHLAGQRRACCGR